jgi:hypothetical protein
MASAMTLRGKNTEAASELKNNLVMSETAQETTLF